MYRQCTCMDPYERNYGHHTIKPVTALYTIVHWYIFVHTFVRILAQQLVVS